MFNIYNKLWKNIIVDTCMSCFNKYSTSTQKVFFSPYLTHCSMGKFKSLSNTLWLCQNEFKVQWIKLWCELEKISIKVHSTSKAFLHLEWNSQVKPMLLVLLELENSFKRAVSMEQATSCWNHTQTLWCLSMFLSHVWCITM